MDREKVRQFCRDRLGINYWDFQMNRLERPGVERKRYRRLGLSLSFPFHKGLEIELEHSLEPRALFQFLSRLTRQQDHSGFTLDVSLLGFGCDMKLFDSRHWNSKESRWYEADEEMRALIEDKAVTAELNAFISDPVNSAVIAEKLKEYISYLGASGRADFRDHLFEREELAGGGV